MAKAYFKGTLIAETHNPVQLEGNYYFPEQDVKMEYLKPSDLHSVCPWKGNASYYNVEVNGEIGKDAAWYYPEPFAAAKQIKGHIAFWKQVEVSG
jgi:uncharacterized protein (DUF427 family)